MIKSSFGFDRPEDSPGLLLWQTTMVWQRLIKNTLLPFDISHPQFVILAILLWFTEQETQPNQVMIIALSKLDKMTVSQSLKKLAHLRLVNRSEHTEDTRAKIVSLTNKGQALAEKLVPLIEKIDAEFFGVLGKAEQASLNKILNHLNR